MFPLGHQFTCLLPTHLRSPKVVTLASLRCNTNSIGKRVAGDRTTHFPVETIVQDERKILVVQCPGVSIHDIRVEYDGHRHGKLQIERKEGLGVEPLHWEWKIDFDTQHEFVQSDTRRPKSGGVDLWLPMLCNMFRAIPDKVIELAPETRAARVLPVAHVKGPLPERV